MGPQRGDLGELLAPLTSRADVTDGIAPQPHHTGTPGESRSVRTAQHAGHTIRIETTYRIHIDGELFPDPIHVGDDGTVHYHGLPQYSVPSAVELTRLIVERMGAGDPPPPIGGGHDHGGGAGA